jgi:glycosyltransferase involved in cell wall biosynthesis
MVGALEKTAAWASMRRRRILRIITRLNTGGPVRHIVSVAGALPRERYEQWLIAGREGPGEGSMRSFVASRGLDPLFVPEMVGTPTLGPGDLIALGTIRRLIREIQPDIVETHTSKAGVLGRLAACLEGSPIVLHVYHGHVLDGYFGAAKTWLARRVERALARTSDQLVAVSPRVKRDLVQYGVAPPDQIAVIEPGIDLEPLLDCRCRRGALRRHLGLEPDAPLAGFIGRLCPIKNPALFLDAAKAILAVRPRVRFVLAGDGQLGGEMRARAEALGLNPHVIFTGWRSDLPKLYADLDVLVSSSNNEGTPFVIIEAMAAGCPVVATAVGGVPDLIDDGLNGLLVAPCDPHQLASAIIRILDDGALAKALADAARDRARVRFAASRLSADMDALYGRLIDRREDVARPRNRMRPARPSHRDTRAEATGLR